MRWNYKKTPDFRIKKRFLLFPKLVNGQWRWLEFASWKEVYDCGYSDSSWVSIEWID